MPRPTTRKDLWDRQSAVTPNSEAHRGNASESPKGLRPPSLSIRLAHSLLFICGGYEFYLDARGGSPTQKTCLGSWRYPGRRARKPSGRHEAGELNPLSWKKGAARK